MASLSRCPRRRKSGNAFGVVAGSYFIGAAAIFDSYGVFYCPKTDRYGDYMGHRRRSREGEIRRRTKIEWKSSLCLLVSFSLFPKRAAAVHMHRYYHSPTIAEGRLWGLTGACFARRNDRVFTRSIPRGTFLHLLNPGFHFRP